jgi:hypothetical protein
VRTDAATLAALRQENSNLKGRGDELERTHGLVKDDAGALRRRVGDVEAQLQRAADDASALRQQVREVVHGDAAGPRPLSLSPRSRCALTVSPPPRSVPSHNGYGHQVNDLTSTNAQQQRRLLDLQAEAEATRRQLNEAQVPPRPAPPRPAPPRFHPALD